MDLAGQLEKQYGHRLRQRVCGICLQDDAILLVQHRGVGSLGEFWSPPGGGMEFGTSATVNLKREFAEETGLEVEVGDLLFVHEHLKAPLHALELFFRVKVLSDDLRTGFDPEWKKEAQLIQHVSFMNWEEIKAKPAAMLHQIFQHTSSPQDLLSLRGYYNFSV